LRDETITGSWFVPTTMPRTWLASTRYEPGPAVRFSTYCTAVLQRREWSTGRGSALAARCGSSAAASTEENDRPSSPWVPGFSMLSERGQAILRTVAVPISLGYRRRT
jgi:hypothetical protein